MVKNIGITDIRITDIRITGITIVVSYIITHDHTLSHTITHYHTRSHYHTLSSCPFTSPVYLNIPHYGFIHGIPDLFQSENLFARQFLVWKELSVDDALIN